MGGYPMDVQKRVFRGPTVVPTTPSILVLVGEEEEGCLAGYPVVSTKDFRPSGAPPHHLVQGLPTALRTPRSPLLDNHGVPPMDALNRVFRVPEGHVHGAMIGVYDLS